MAEDDKSLSDDVLTKAADVFKVLGNTQRLRIVETLSKQEELNVGEIASTCGGSQPVMSQHLNQMRRIGVVASRRKGTQVFYRLTGDSPKAILNYLKKQQPDESSTPTGEAEAAASEQLPAGAEPEPLETEPEGWQDTLQEAKND